MRPFTLCQVIMVYCVSVLTWISFVLDQQEVTVCVECGGYEAGAGCVECTGPVDLNGIYIYLYIYIYIIYMYIYIYIYIYMEILFIKK